MPWFSALNHEHYARWVVGEFGRSMLTSSEEFGSAVYRHHEQTLSVQQELEKQIRSLTSVMEGMGNPFQEESPDFLMLDTHIIMDEKVIETVRNIESTGDHQYRQFVEECILKKDNQF
eukprot:Seg4587.3 transcript_id=Seg4587.3/GoldUCD/mRNA.D3Y31 product="hypothetical protein" protein_id=Seg4587.3/GoldUCD/D3Y31